MVSLIENRQYDELFASDQLTKERDEERAVFLGFKEGVFSSFRALLFLILVTLGKYDFAPTFKVVRDKPLEYNVSFILFFVSGPF